MEAPIFPRPIFPFGIDSSYTLFRVYNNTQSVLAENLSIEDTTIHIIPSNLEIWPENGFVTVQDELIYYDLVGRDENGTITSLQRCVRGVENKIVEHTIGTPIYGNVVAQQHNQLASAIIQLESTIGDLTESIKKTPQIDQEFSASLHATLATLSTHAAVGDDACPDVEFEVNTGLPVADGTTMEFCLRIYGQNASFSIDFGDGNVTTTEYSGTHQYGAGGPFSPTVTVITSQCTIVQQPSTPDAGCEITPAVSPSQPFHIPIPEVPNFPSFVAPRRACPGPLLNLPPLLVPNASLASVISIAAISIIENISLISRISLVGCCLPSSITVVGCSFPSMITVNSDIPSLIQVESSIPSTISFDVNVNVPSFISYVGCCPPSFISYVGCCPPSFISYIGCCPPSVISIQGDFSLPSIITVDGSSIPSAIDVSVVIGVLPSAISIECCSITFAPTPSFVPIGFNISQAESIFFSPITFDFQAVSFSPITFDFQAVSFSPITFDTPPIFSIIQFETPPLFAPITFATPPSITVNWGIPPTVSCIVTVACPSATPLSGTPVSSPFFQDKFEESVPMTMDLGIPEEIRVIAPRIPDIMMIHDLPEEIKITAPRIPDINIIENIPREISIVAYDVPKSIYLDATDVPTKILVEASPNFPSTLRLEAFGIPDRIQVVGIPPTIEIVNFPSTIQLVMPEDPTIELVYKGSPLELGLSPNLEKLLSQIILVQPGT